MGLNTDLHASPYFNDFDEEKNFHQIVFKPSVAVQARELTQLQSILQNQIERFGDNILEKGTIVKGGNFYDYKNLPYVKIEDNHTNGNVVNMRNFNGATLTGVNSGVTAIVLTYLEGNTNLSPNLNTLYVKYTKSGIDVAGKDLKTFIPGETLQVTIGGVIQPDVSVAVASLNLDPKPIGVGYAVSCGDGIIYQKGYFVRFEDQITVISRYSNLPDGISVGFVTEEEIITAEDDDTLYNNAQGFYNENTSGADRIKLTAKLVYYTTEEAEADENFLALQEYQEGRLIRRNLDTKFNSISKELEKRTYEESGNYSVTGYNMFVSENPGDSNNLTLSVGAGLSYVNGKRVQNISRFDLDLPKSTEFESVYNQDILANYGNFIYVDGVVGSFPFETFGLVTLRNVVQSATTLVGYSATGNSMGTARVLSYDKESDGRYRVYLFDIKMSGTNTFSGVKSITTGAAFANLILESGRAVLKDASFKSLIFPLGHSAVKEILTTNTDYVYRKETTVAVSLSGTLLLTVVGDESFPYTAGSSLTSDSIRDLIVTDATTGLVMNIQSASVDATGNTLTINLGTLATPIDVKVVYNVKKMRVKPTGKTIRTVYMRIDAANGNTAGTYYLGWPDVISIEGVWRGTNNTFTESTAGVTNVTANFTLNKNITDMYYGISFIKKKPTFAIAETHKFLVKAKVFVKDTSGSFSQSFFCVNSYPVDDTSVVLPANKIRTQDIPNNARDVIDFRPYAKNIAAYATTPAGATIGTTAAPLSAVNFTEMSYLAAPNRPIETSYSYYLSRRDLLVIDEKGEFTLIMGETGTNPTYPVAPSKAMPLVKIYVPAYPSLIPAIATKTGYPEYAVKLFRENNKSYTMKDISDLENRLDNIEYYTILNALEKSAEDMVIKDSDGLNRFKNGIFVDNFDDLLACEVKSPDFMASVDRGESALYPRFRAYNLELRDPVAGGGVILNRDTVATMVYKNVVMQQQKFATKYRSCVTDFYSFDGVGAIYPEYDNGYDETFAPDVNVTVDMAGAFTEFTEALGEIVPLTVKNTKVSESTKNLGSTSSTNVTQNTSGRTTTTTSTTTTTNSKLVTKTSVTNTAKLQTQKPTTTTQQVGDFITDMTISPYLRANNIRVAFSGLRPNTRFWVWFDGKPVTNRCAMAKPNANPNLADEVKHIIRKGKWGSPLRSDANGELLFIFALPGETFYVGDRELLVMDVDDLESDEATTSTGIVTYSGFNFSVEKTGLEISTRSPNYDVRKTKAVSVDKKIVRTQNVVTTTTSTTNTDPIAQTFYVDPSYTNSDSLMITSVQIPFKKKSANKGITLQIRKTVNGYPAGEVLPFGSVRLKPTQIVVSDNASAYTTFTFKSPITLAAGESYAIVLIPDGNSPDYLVFCAQTGQNDLKTGAKITSDVNSGTLFTSTNNMAWTPYQDENMTFVIKKAQFTDNNGFLNLSPNFYEFFELSTFSGAFRRGETVFAQKPFATGTVTTTNDSNIITGVGTTFNTVFAVGDYIAIENTTDGSWDVSRIDAINSNTNMVLAEVMKDNLGSRKFFKTVVGTCDYFNVKAPMRLIVKESSAKAGNVFAAGNTVIGENSGATALIDTIGNLPVSHYQPNIYRTNFNNTSTNLTLARQTNVNGTLTLPNRPQVFGDNNRLINIPTVIKSRSNEVTQNAGVPSFTLRVNLSMNGNGPHYISPIVDYDISGITVFEYLINTQTSSIVNSEKKDGGDGLAKYISKKVTLRDGFDAEDLKLWITAYKPTGTEIDVYVKFISDIDNTPISEMPWTLLENSDSNKFRSSSTNLEDYKEFEYSIGDTAAGPNGGAFVQNGNFSYVGPDGQVYENFKHFIIKIVFTSSGQNTIPKVRDIRAIALT